MKDLFLQYRTWCKIGLFTFGGGYVILPMINKEIVQKYGWVTNEEVMDYYAIGQSLPGVIAVNTAAFIGYKLRGVPGAVASVLGVISPSIVLITILALLLSGFQDIPVVRHMISGIQISVCVLMTATIVQLWKSSVKDIIGLLFCLTVFALAYFMGVSTVTLVVLSAVFGIMVKTVAERNKARKKAESE